MPKNVKVRVSRRFFASNTYKIYEQSESSEEFWFMHEKVRNRK